MAEVVSVVAHPIVINGRTYRVQVCGRPAGHVWEGWIEFEASTGDVFRTARETTQPDRDAVEYWAGGLSTTYLEGAFARALNPSVAAPPAVVVAAPHFSAPAPAVLPPQPGVFRSAVLDPYSVGAKGIGLLRQELRALRGWHLRNIIVAYSLADPTLDLESLSEPALIELIVAAVEPSVSA